MEKSKRTRLPPFITSLYQMILVIRTRFYTTHEPRMVEAYRDMNLRGAWSNYYEIMRIGWLKLSYLKKHLHGRFSLFSRSSRLEKRLEWDFLFTNAATNLGKSYWLYSPKFVSLFCMNCIHFAQYCLFLSDNSVGEDMRCPGVFSFFVFLAIHGSDTSMVDVW